MTRTIMKSGRSSRIMLILLASAVMACASPSLPQKSSEGSGAAHTYCQLIACVGEMKDECEMRIRIMDNYDATIQQERGGSDDLKIDKAISIEFLKDWTLKDSLSLNRFKSGDKLLYRSYKEADTDYYARFHSSFLRVTRKIRLDEQAPGYKFTFRQIVRAAESLARQDKTDLGAEKLLVKKRTFQNAPTDSFFTSPIQRSDLY